MPTASPAADAALLEQAGQPVGLGAQLGVGPRAGVALLALPHDRLGVGGGLGPPVAARVGQVGAPAGEPAWSTGCRRSRRAPARRAWRTGCRGAGRRRPRTRPGRRSSGRAARRGRRSRARCRSARPSSWPTRPPADATSRPSSADPRSLAGEATRPSRMSLSDTSSSSMPSVRTKATSTQQPADDHVGPRLLQARVVDPVGQALGGQRAEHVLDGRPREAEVVDVVAVVLGQPDLDGGDRRDGAGQADDGLGLRAPPAPRATRSSNHAGRLGDGVAELLGRRRVAGQVLLGEAHAADVEAADRRRARRCRPCTRWTRRRCRRPGTARRSGRGRRWRRRS